MLFIFLFKKKNYTRRAAPGAEPRGHGRRGLSRGRAHPAAAAAARSCRGEPPRAHRRRVACGGELGGDRGPRGECLRAVPPATGGAPARDSNTHAHTRSTRHTHARDIKTHSTHSTQQTNFKNKCFLLHTVPHYCSRECVCVFSVGVPKPFRYIPPPPKNTPTHERRTPVARQRLLADARARRSNPPCIARHAPRLEKPLGFAPRRPPAPRRSGCAQTYRHGRGC